MVRYEQGEILLNRQPLASRKEMAAQISYIPDLAQTICDDYLFLDQGTILAAGNREDILRAAAASGKEECSLEEAYLRLLERGEGA